MDNGNSFACATNKDAAKLGSEYRITLKIKFSLYDKHVSYSVLLAVYDIKRGVVACCALFTCCEYYNTPQSDVRECTQICQVKIRSRTARDINKSKFSGILEHGAKDTQTKKVCMCSKTA